MSIHPLYKIQAFDEKNRMPVFYIKGRELIFGVLWFRQKGLSL